MDRVTRLQQLCDRHRQIAEQERLHLWLHAWLVLHIPLAVALLALGAAPNWPCVVRP